MTSWRDCGADRIGCRTFRIGSRKSRKVYRTSRRGCRTSRISYRRKGLGIDEQDRLKEEQNSQKMSRIGHGLN